MKLHLFKEITVRLPRTRMLALFRVVTRAEAGREARARVNVIFTDDRRMRSLNQQFRGLDRSTDVLSFNMDEPGDADATFGEIYISVPTARRQARDFGNSPGQELLRLTCHGLLHLFGYDHAKRKDAQKMESLEEHYLRLVNKGPET